MLLRIGAAPRRARPAPAGRRGAHARGATLEIDFLSGARAARELLKPTHYDLMVRDRHHERSEWC